MIEGLTLLAIATGLTTQLSLNSMPGSQGWPTHRANWDLSISQFFRSKRPSKDFSPKLPTACPHSLPELTAWMLQDIPSYANRALQQSWSRLQRNQNRNSEPRWLLNQIILAGKPEFEPLSISIFSPPEIDLHPNIQQVFFTTLERNYWNTSTPRISLSTSYHWVFLVADQQEWKLVQMFSRFGKSTNAKTALPPRDSTNGAIANGIRVWLRDCQEGTLSSQPPTQDQKNRAINLSDNRSIRISNTNN